MAFVITTPCIGVRDRACVPVCPTDCIHPRADENRETPMLYINPAECIDCAACVDACPVQAIVLGEDLTEGQRVFQEINADYYALAPGEFDAKWRDRHRATP